MEESSWQNFLTAEKGWIAVATFLAIALPTILLFFNQIMFMPWRKLIMGGLPPGHLGLPFLGNAMEMFRNSNPDDTMNKRYKAYGPISKHLVLGNPGVSVFDPSEKKLVFMNEGTLFQVSWPPSVKMCLGESSLITMSRDPHKATRALLSRWLSFEYLQRYLLQVEAQVVRCVEKLLKKGDVLFYDEARELTFGIICNILLSVPAESPICKEISDLFVAIVAGLFEILPIDSPWTKFGKSMDARRKTIKILEKIYAQKKVEIAAAPNRSELQPRDVMDAFILYGEGDSAAGGKVGGYSEAEIYDTVITMLFAGHETTASLHSWLVYVLRSHPQTLKALREEHDTIARSKSAGEGITWADYKSMKFTQKVILETQRMEGTVPSVFRETLADVKIGDFIIPKGWKVQVGLTHSSNCTDAYFKDPEVFNPDNFNQAPPPHVFQPFGSGVRICPGMELARMELCLFVHYFVTRCDWEGLEPDAPHIYFPIRVPSQGYRVKIEPRREVPSEE